MDYYDTFHEDVWEEVKTWDNTAGATTDTFTDNAGGVESELSIDWTFKVHALTVDALDTKTNLQYWGVSWPKLIDVCRALDTTGCSDSNLGAAYRTILSGAGDDINDAAYDMLKYTLGAHVDVDSNGSVGDSDVLD